MIILLALMTNLFSLNANALEVVAGVYGAATVSMGLWALTSTTVGPDCAIESYCKAASQVIADFQDYQQTGMISSFLAERIKATQALDNSLSEQEALDSTVSAAIEILK